MRHLGTLTAPGLMGRVVKFAIFADSCMFLYARWDNATIRRLTETPG
jgi:hypothetical protein